MEGRHFTNGERTGHRQFLNTGPIKAPLLTFFRQPKGGMHQKAVELNSKCADGYHINDGDMIMKLKFVATQKPQTQNPTIQRRQRMVRRIDQQIVLLNKAESDGLPSTSWVWMDDEGTCLLSVKYGRQVLDLEKGMPSIFCGDLNKAVEVITYIRAMALEGQLDDQLANASSDIRKKFKAG